MEITPAPNDPRVVRSGRPDEAPVPQHEAYLVLPEAERAKGFVRPVRRSYRHAGPSGPKHPLRDLTPEEHESYDKFGYVKKEEYPESELPVTGRFWTQEQLDTAARGGCGTVTTMGQELAETYARDPNFYGFTYCCGCRMHRPVAEFRWEPDGSVLGS